MNIPAGVDNGDKVRLSGEGEWQKGGQSGDLYVAIRVLENPLFERDGKIGLDFLGLKLNRKGKL